MPAIRPIENEPRTTAEREEDKLVSSRESQTHPVRHRHRFNSRGKAIAGSKVASAQSVSGGTFTPKQTSAEGNFRE